MKEFNLEEFKKDPSKKVVTRDGREVRIICTDMKQSNCPLIALVTDKEDNKESLLSYKENGRYYFHDSINDLFFTPVKIKKEGWVNIYRYEDDARTIGCLFKSEEEAKLHKYDKTSVYIKTIKIEWEE